MTKLKIYNHFLTIKQEKGAGYFVLIDPDKITHPNFLSFIRDAEESGVDGFLMGGSLVIGGDLEHSIAKVKESTSLPIILFPGSLFQISPNADAILYLLLISGRNPDHLIGNQVVASPMIRRMGLEAISTGYMLIESGKTTAAVYMSNTRPIPRHKPEIAVAHAMAAEHIGLKLLYLDAGSGAEEAVPDEMIYGIAKQCELPMFIGGGIRTPEEAARKVRAGASFIVTGTVMEEKADSGLMKAFGEAIHSARK